jgi:hypothetical protein
MYCGYPNPTPSAPHVPGKSSVAQQLAARINIPNVMQTDVLCELLRCGEAPSLARQPLWARTDLGGGGGLGPGGGGGGGGLGPGGVSQGGGQGGAAADAALLAEFKRECRVVRQAMQGDLVKVGRWGRPSRGRRSAGMRRLITLASTWVLLYPRRARGRLIKSALRARRQPHHPIRPRPLHPTDPVRWQAHHHRGLAPGPRPVHPGVCSRWCDHAACPCRARHKGRQPAGDGARPQPGGRRCGRLGGRQHGGRRRRGRDAGCKVSPLGRTGLS